MIENNKINVKGNTVILPKGKGKDEVVLEKSLHILRGIFSDKMGKKIGIPIKRDR